MGTAVSSVLDISAWVSGLDGATVVVPAFGPGALAVLALALLLLTLLTTPLRLLGLAAVPAGLALAMQHPRPDLFVDREGSGGRCAASTAAWSLSGALRPSWSSNGCERTATAVKRTTQPFGLGSAAIPSAAS